MPPSKTEQQPKPKERYIIQKEMCVYIKINFNKLKMEITRQTVTLNNMK